MRRTSHAYSPEQQQWFFDQMNFKGTAQQIREGMQLGRACCGSRCLSGKVEEKWQDVKLVDTNFKDWHCMVDWYFLHIDQHTGLIYHHQTCQALLDKKRGSLGHVSDRVSLLENLKNRLNQNIVEHIVCPNNRCGCGMCVPKAKEFSDFEMIAESVTDLTFSK